MKRTAELYATAKMLDSVAAEARMLVEDAHLKPIERDNLASAATDIGTVSSMIQMRLGIKQTERDVERVRAMKAWYRDHPPVIVELDTPIEAEPSNTEASNTEAMTAEAMTADPTTETLLTSAPFGSRAEVLRFMEELQAEGERVRAEWLDRMEPTRANAARLRRAKLHAAQRTVHEAAHAAGVTHGHYEFNAELDSLGSPFPPGLGSPGWGLFERDHHDPEHCNCGIPKCSGGCYVHRTTRFTIRTEEGFRVDEQSTVSVRVLPGGNLEVGITPDRNVDSRGK